MPKQSFNGGYVARLVAADLVGTTDLCDFARYESSLSGMVSVDEVREDFTARLLSWIGQERLPK
jgi:hypothetical protein